jgi:hypothetical protein
MIEALTTAVRPAERAKMVMMSSAALPKVAFRMPPTRGPAWCPRLSVACPRTQARPMRAREVRAKIRRTWAWRISTTTGHRERHREPVGDLAHLYKAPLLESTGTACLYPHKPGA